MQFADMKSLSLAFCWGGRLGVTATVNSMKILKKLLAEPHKWNERTYMDVVEGIVAAEFNSDDFGAGTGLL